LWLADAVLAHHLKWPAPMPLIAGQIRRSELRAGQGGRVDDKLDTGLFACRAHQLLTAAPKLWGRDAAHRVEMLVAERRLRFGRSSSHVD